MTTRPASDRPPSTGWTTGRAGLYAAVAAYLLVTFVQLLPLFHDLRHQLPSDPGDPVLNAWILWWNAHAWPLTARWWNAPAFYPAPGVLSFSEHLVGLSPLTTPIQWLTGSPELAYNVAFIISFPLSAVAMHLLVRNLTGRDEVAFVAGAAYGFSPYRVAQIAHLQVLFSFWMPLALLGLHAGSRGRRWGFPFAAACWLMQGLANGYLLLYFPVLAGLWLLWFTVRRPRTLAVAVAWFAAAGLIALPFLLGYLRFHATYDMTRTLSEIEFYSSDVSAIFGSSYHLKLWGEILKPTPEGELFPGFVVLGIAVAGLVWAIGMTHVWAVLHPSTARGRVRWLHLSFGGVAAIWGALALTSWLSGGFSIPLGVASIPVVNWDKPLKVAVAAGLLYVASGYQGVSAPRLDRTTAFYLLAAALMLTFCWGPAPHFRGKPFWHLGAIEAPYAYLLMLPGYDGLRVPSRFGLLWVLCLSVAAALVLARAFAPSRRTTAIAAVLGCVAIAEGWFGPVPVVPSPLAEPVPWTADVAGASAVAELPMGRTATDLAAVLRGAVHGKPVVNGYSGYFPPHEVVIEEALRRGDLAGLEALRPYGPIAVVVHADRSGGKSLVARIDRSPAFIRRGAWSDTVLYWMTPLPAPATPPTGPRLPVASAIASTGLAWLPQMTDGRLDTRWTSDAPQRGGEWVFLDLGAPSQVETVTLRLGRFPDDYPRRLQVDVSNDAATWTRVFRGAASGLAVTGALADPVTLPIRVPAGARCRYIRLTQIGRDRQMYWSIAELSVQGSPPSDRR